MTFVFILLFIIFLGIFYHITFSNTINDEIIYKFVSYNINSIRHNTKFYTLLTHDIETCIEGSTDDCIGVKFAFCISNSNKEVVVTKKIDKCIYDQLDRNNIDTIAGLTDTIVKNMCLVFDRLINDIEKDNNPEIYKELQNSYIMYTLYNSSGECLSTIYTLIDKDNTDIWTHAVSKCGVNFGVSVGDFFVNCRNEFYDELREYFSE